MLWQQKVFYHRSSGLFTMIHWYLTVLYNWAIILDVINSSSVRKKNSSWDSLKYVHGSYIGTIPTNIKKNLMNLFPLKLESPSFWLKKNGKIRGFGLLVNWCEQHFSKPVKGLARQPTKVFQLGDTIYKYHHDVLLSCHIIVQGLFKRELHQ